MDSNPQIYLGASIAASAQAAVQSDCPEADSPGCQSGIQSALNPGNALVIQARAVPLLIGATALIALLAVVVGYFRLTDPSVRAQVVELQPDVYTSLASVQYSASVVFVTASDDAFPVTAPMNGAGAMNGTTTGGFTTTTGGSVPATG